MYELDVFLSYSGKKHGPFYNFGGVSVNSVPSIVFIRILPTAGVSYSAQVVEL